MSKESKVLATLKDRVDYRGSRLSGALTMMAMPYCYGITPEADVRHVRPWLLDTTIYRTALHVMGLSTRASASSLSGKEKQGA